MTSRMGIPGISAGNDVFPSGSMFWVRLEALRPMLDAHLDEWEFEPEASQIDATMAHAVERIFALVVRAASFDVATTSDLVSGASRISQRRYPYAVHD